MHMIIDDFRRTDLISTLGTQWRGVSDRVMGGISRQALHYDDIQGRRCLRLIGDVRLENNGGFVQMALDLSEPDNVLDASEFTGVAMAVYGNDEPYSVHLRTPACVRPWQSYRAQFMATRCWQPIRLPFADFIPHRLVALLDLRRLRRLGLVAIGRAFKADLAVADVHLYND
jgi:hypothetical protein